MHVYSRVQATDADLRVLLKKAEAERKRLQSELTDVTSDRDRLQKKADSLEHALDEIREQLGASVGDVTARGSDWSWAGPF
jgi:chromosome segregation ATPase